MTYTITSDRLQIGGWAASNVLEAMDPIPADYADGSRWPS
jgi:hypothetical protein